MSDTDTQRPDERVEAWDQHIPSHGDLRPYINSLLANGVPQDFVWELATNIWTRDSRFNAALARAERAESAIGEAYALCHRIHISKEDTTIEGVMRFLQRYDHPALTAAADEEGEE